MTYEELEQIEAQKAEAEQDIKVGEALKKMIETEEYKLVVETGYFEDYARELGEAIAGNTGAYDEDKLISDLKGIKSFVGFTFMLAKRADAAKQTLAGLEQYIAEQEEQE